MSLLLFGLRWTSASGVGCGVFLLDDQGHGCGRRNVRCPVGMSLFESLCYALLLFGHTRLFTGNCGEGVCERTNSETLQAAMTLLEAKKDPRDSPGGTPVYLTLCHSGIQLGQENPAHGAGSTEPAAPGRHCQSHQSSHHRHLHHDHDQRSTRGGSSK